MSSFLKVRARRLAALPVALFSLAVVACDDDSSGPGTPIEWQAELAGVGEFEEVEGTAAVISTRSALEATIELANAPADATFAWTIATGTCAQPGTAIGAATRYPELEVSEDGAAEAEADVPAGLNSAGSYIVRVIDDSGESPVVVACGALAKES